jgi:hypothetical protein
MKKGLEEILNICLERITVKGDSIEQCLASYPEQATELEPLLRVALSVSKASSYIKPRPEFERIAKYRFLSALETRRNEKAPRRTQLWGWQRRWAVAFAAILILILLGSSTITASASSLPGDTLYPMKTATEKVQGFFTFGSEAKANFHMKLAQRRLAELESLTERSRNVPEWLQAIEILGREEPAKAELVNRLMGITSGQNTVLTQVMEKVPPQARERFQQALERAEQAREKVRLLKEKGSGADKPKGNSPLSGIWGNVSYSWGSESGSYFGGIALLGLLDGELFTVGGNESIAFDDGGTGSQQNDKANGKSGATH